MTVRAVIMMLLIYSVAIPLSAQTEEATPTPSVEPTPPTLVIEPLLGIGVNPPLDITLPDDWELVMRDTFTYRDLLQEDNGGIETLPIDVYYGPVTGGNGWIVMLWGYDSLVPYDPSLSEAQYTEAQYYERASWLNGLRMLQLVVFDSTRCNIGTAPQREYELGGLLAIGTTFSAVDCPFEQPDTRGWFATLNISNLNFSFFAYADPIQPAGAPFETELQAILDSIEFRVDEITISAEDFEATREAIALTPRPTSIFPTATPSPGATP
ncbi:MAG: hypothetical protein ACFE0Q_05540 [Anaerolineae bacterium]